AAKGGSAVGSGDHRPLHPHPRHLSVPGEDEERPDGRDSAHQRPAGIAEIAADLRLRGERRPPRYRKQAGISEGRGLLRATAPRPCRQVLRLPDGARPASDRRQAMRRPAAFLAPTADYVVLLSFAAGADVSGFAAGVSALLPDDALLSAEAVLVSLVPSLF